MPIHVPYLFSLNAIYCRCGDLRVRTPYILVLKFEHVHLTLSLLVATFVVCFANSLDLDQARQNIGPDLDPNCLTLMVF